VPEDINSLNREELLDQLQRQRKENLLKSYDKVCESYHRIDDFRMKLLGILPIASAGGIFFLLSDSIADPNKQTTFFSLLGPIGLFGCLVTFGLFCFELYGIKKCDRLIKAGTQLEDSLQVLGQFNSRPRALLVIINEPFAAGLIYPAVLAAWLFLVLIPVTDSELLPTGSQTQAGGEEVKLAINMWNWVGAVLCFLFFFVLTLFYNCYFQKQPKVHRVKLQRTPAGRTVNVIIYGKHLGLTRSVRVVQNGSEICLKICIISDDEIRGELTIGDSAPTGQWDLTIESRDFEKFPFHVPSSD